MSFVHAAATIARVIVTRGAVVSSAVVDADRAPVAVPASVFPVTVWTTFLDLLLPSPHFFFFFFFFFFFRRNVRHLFFGVHFTSRQDAASQKN